MTKNQQSEPLATRVWDHFILIPNTQWPRRRSPIFSHTHGSKIVELNTDQIPVPRSGQNKLYHLLPLVIKPFPVARRACPHLESNNLE